MGVCSSLDATSVATAKLILQDGRLQEYSFPVKVSYVLAKHPYAFICNSDEMLFDDVISAVDESEELQLGQLYFALPISKLRHRFTAEEMAALAVKASSALVKSGCGENWGPFSPAIGMDGKRTSSRVAADGGVRRERSRRNSDRQRREFTAVLSVIPE